MRGGCQRNLFYSGECPGLDPLTDTSVATLPALPDQEHLTKTLNSILFLNITDSKSYSAHTRAFVATFAPIDERSIVNTLKNPDEALKEAQKMTESAKHERQCNYDSTSHPLIDFLAQRQTRTKHSGWLAWVLLALQAAL